MKLVGRIATGEGKTRISAILSAYYALDGGGQCVDLFTSSEALVRQCLDGLSQFVGVLGITVECVTINSNPQDKKRHIRVTDLVNLALARANVEVTGIAQETLSDEKIRCVAIVDEVDTVLYPEKRHKYEYSQLQEDYEYYPWIYIAALSFIDETLPEKRLVGQFKAYCKENYEDISQLTPDALEGVLAQAKNFRELKLVDGVDYEIGVKKVNLLGRYGEVYKAYPFL